MSKVEKGLESLHEPQVREIPKKDRTIVLIPTPSEDPRDPLNWSTPKKYLTLGALCFGAFAAGTAPAAHQTAYFAIAEAYERDPVDLTYTLSAAIAGLLGGPFLIAPLAKLLGRTAVVFWCFVAIIATQIWSAVLTRPADYISFVVSRLLSGIFSSLPTVLGSGYIMDMFFLHQRGWTFASYSLALTLGVVASPTIGGFVVESEPWPVLFWWTLGPLGLAAIIFAVWVEDTEYAPGRSEDFTSSLSESFLVCRIQCLTGLGVVPPITARRFLLDCATPFVIGVAPVTVAAGFYILVNFAWAILVSNELAIFMQLPEADGGYAFSASQNAAFTFIAWISVFAAQAFGAVCNDRMPIWLSMQRKGDRRGRWHPEDRLWSLLMGPASLSPIGLGLIGAALQYHLHYMVLAVGYFLLIFSASIGVPVCVNYVAETFIGRAVEVTVTMGAYRTALGLSLTFYFRPWQQAVGVGWLFGMAAFFAIFSMAVLAALAWHGERIRSLALQRNLTKSEDGKLLAIDRDSPFGLGYASVLEGDEITLPGLKSPLNA